MQTHSTVNFLKLNLRKTRHILTDSHQHPFPTYLKYVHTHTPYKFRMTQLIYQWNAQAWGAIKRQASWAHSDGTWDRISHQIDSITNKSKTHLIQSFKTPHTQGWNLDRSKNPFKYVRSSGGCFNHQHPAPPEGWVAESWIITKSRFFPQKSCDTKYKNIKQCHNATSLGSTYQYLSSQDQQFPVWPISWPGISCFLLSPMLKSGILIRIKMSNQWGQFS